jgi:Rv0078B-related antitoxin
MMDAPLLTPEEKLQLAFEMHELGCSMMRQNLSRRFPEDTAEEHERRFVEWLQARPGAERGDAVGRSRPIP